ncbi:MAG: hypothetical protein QM718_09250 [Steroidobacteraceae bacterium]
MTTSRAAHGFALLLALCALPGAALAIDAVEVDVASASGPEGVKLQQGHLRFTPDERHAQLDARFGSLQAPFLPQVLRQVALQCVDLVVREPRFACGTLRLDLQDSPLGSQQLAGRIAFDSDRSRLQLALDGLKAGGGTAALQARLEGVNWQISAKARALSLVEVAKLVQPWLTLPPGVALTGRMDAALDSRGDARGARHSEVRAQLRQVDASNEAGTVATDQLGFDLGIQLEGSGPVQLALQFKSSGGQALAGPVLLDFNQHPLQAELRGDWQPQALRIARLQVVQPQVLQLSGTAEIALAPAVRVRSAQLALEDLQFPAAYASFVQLALAGTDFGELDSSGHVRGTLRVVDDAPQSIDVSLQDLQFRDDKRKLGASGLDGDLHWRAAAGAATPSQLSWQMLRAYGLEAGAAQLAFTAAAQSFALTQPVRIPVFDGALAIQNFAAEFGSGGQPALQFDANIEPISVARLSVAFGWPEMAGSLSGRIPGMTYRDKTLSINGDLSARVFDGQVTVSKLMLQDPLGAWPRFNASIAARNLDLDQITHTFPIGSITGRLDADVNGLELFNWEPVAFDAHLYTTPGDRSRHRISQKAVSSLSDIGGTGGGVSAALQSGLLKFFDDFGYRSIGLSCQLRNDVCLMNGIPRAEGGFYIVKGGGLPRIDITGNSGRVAWSTLLSQINAAINNSGDLEVR